MRRAIFTKRNAVVREHVDDVQRHQCGEANRRTHVIGENQEGRAERNHATVGSHAIGDRAHGVLAHAEMHIAARETPPSSVGALLVDADRRRRIEITEVLQRGLGRWIEIGRAARQRR